MNESKKERLGSLIKLIESFLQLARQNSGEQKLCITEDTDIYDDLGVDSLEAMDLVHEIEKKFNVSLDAQELMQQRKILQIVNYIETKMV